MTVRRSLVLLVSLGPMLGLLSLQSQTGSADEDYLRWSSSQVESIGKSTYASGKVGSSWDGRGLKTERAINYKLRASWFTPDVVRASARKLQLQDRLSDEATRNLVSEAEAVGDTVVMVELDPNEGSGVIPSDWECFLQTRGDPSDSEHSVKGKDSPQLRRVQALQGVLQRNYDYDRFWVVFPLLRGDGSPLFPETASEAEVVVRIKDKEGKTHWAIPDSIRSRIKVLAATRLGLPESASKK